MLTLRTLAAPAFFACLLNLASTTSQAQGLLASNNTYAAASPRHDSPAAAPAAPDSGETVVIAGKITNPAGVLPGAVVILAATKQMAVTNAEGEFEFVVPANSGPLRARVTYMGFADELMTLDANAAQSTVNLANAVVIVVARKQRLKVYLRTARKQIRRELRKMRS